MIRQLTALECDGNGCGETLVGDMDGHANSVANTLAIGRKNGWGRVHGARNGEILDLCCDCLAAFIYGLDFPGDPTSHAAAHAVEMAERHEAMTRGAA